MKRTRIFKAYRRLWLNDQTKPHDAAQEVLKDLATFCFAQQSTFVVGQAQQTAFNEGKRAVWLHIYDKLYPPGAARYELHESTSPDLFQLFHSHHLKEDEHEPH